MTAFRIKPLKWAESELRNQLEADPDVARPEAVGTWEEGADFKDMRVSDGVDGARVEFD